MINILILFAVLLLLAYLTNYFLVRSFLGYKWRIFVAPGVILHELSHALACYLTFTKVVKINFFDKDGGSVKHARSPIPIFGPILISIAPLVVGIVIFYFFGKIINVSENTFDISAIFSNLKSIYKTIDFTNWLNILIGYFLLSVAVTMTPSWQDLVNMILPLIVLVGIFYLLYRFTAFNISSFDSLAINLLPILNLAVFILLCLLAVSLVFYLLTKIISK